MSENKILTCKHCGGHDIEIDVSETHDYAVDSQGEGFAVYRDGALKTYGEPYCAECGTEYIG